MNRLFIKSRNGGKGRFATGALALVTALSLGACSSSDDDADPADASSNGSAADAMPGAPDAMPSGPDAMAAAVQIPEWTLEDIQPASPKFGEVYGLDEFGGKIVVAVLVEGF